MVHAQSARDLPSSCIKKYYGVDGAAYDEQGVGVAPLDEALETSGLLPIKEYIQ